VVHERDALEAGIGGRLDGGSKPSGRIVVPGELRDLQDEPKLARSALLLSRCRVRAGAVARLELSVARRRAVDDDHGVPAFASDLVGDVAHPGQLCVEGSRRNRPVALAISPTTGHDVSREDHRHRGHARSLRRVAVSATAAGLETERVDHGRQPPPKPCTDDRVENYESVRGRLDVVGAAPDDRAQCVRRHHFVVAVPRRRPRRLA
jgi:hypothetical protein